MSIYFKRRAKAPRVVHVSYNLTGVTLTDDRTVIILGKSYTTTISATGAFNYVDVIVTMGGVDITASVYSNGVVSIPSATGDISISATAKNTDFLTWYFNDVLPTSATLKKQTIDFTLQDHKQRFRAIEATSFIGVYSLKYYTGSSNFDTVFSRSLTSDPNWKSEAYRTVTFGEVPTGDLRTWLEANATPL